MADQLLKMRKKGYYIPETETNLIGIRIKVFKNTKKNSITMNELFF